MTLAMITFYTTLKKLVSITLDLYVKVSPKTPNHLLRRTGWLCVVYVLKAACTIVLLCNKTNFTFYILTFPFEEVT